MAAGAGATGGVEFGRDGRPQPAPAPVDLSAPVAPYFADKDMAAVDEMAVPPEKADFSAHAEGEVVDEEIREFFLEEFNELVENLNKLMPQWRANPQDKTLTTDVRRAFHTLKGSGRTVGYQFLGEFAWQNERLLNGVNEGLFKNNELIQDVINDSLDLLNILQKQEDFSEPAGGLLAQAAVAEKVRDELAENPDQNQESLHRLAHQYRLGGSAPQSSSGDSVDFHLDDEVPTPAAGSASLTAAPAGKDLSALAEEFSVEIAASKAARGEGSKLSASLGGQNNEADHSALNFALDGEARGESLSVGAAPTGPTAHNFQSIVEAIRTAGPAAFDVGSPAFDTLGAVISSRLENHAALQDSRIRRQIAEQLTEALDDLPPLPIVEQLLERVAKQITHFGDTPNGLSIAEDNPLFSTDVIGGALAGPAPIGAEQLREIEAKIRAELSQQPSGASPEQLVELEAKIRSELATSPARMSPEQLAEIEAKVRAELSAEPATASAEQLQEIEAKIRADIAAQNAELLQRQLAEAPERRLSPSERAEIEAQIRSELTAQSTALLSQQVSQSAGVSAEQLAAIEARLRTEIAADNDALIQAQVAAQLTTAPALDETNFKRMLSTLRAVLASGHVDDTVESALAATISRRWGKNEALRDDESRQHIADQLSAALDNISPEVLASILDRAVGKVNAPTRLVLGDDEMTVPAGFSDKTYKRIATTLRGTLDSEVAIDDTMIQALAKVLYKQIEPVNEAKLAQLQSALASQFALEGVKNVERLLPSVFERLGSMMEEANFGQDPAHPAPVAEASAPAATFAMGTSGDPLSDSFGLAGSSKASEGIPDFELSANFGFRGDDPVGSDEPIELSGGTFELGHSGNFLEDSFGLDTPRAAVGSGSPGSGSTQPVASSGAPVPSALDTSDSAGTTPSALDNLASLGITLDENALSAAGAGGTASLSPGNASGDGPNWDLALDFSSSRRSNEIAEAGAEKAAAENGALELPLDESFSSSRRSDKTAEAGAEEATAESGALELQLDESFSSSRRSDTTSVGGAEKAMAESGALELPLDESFSSSRRSNEIAEAGAEKAAAESGALELPLDESFSSAEEKTSLGLDFNLNDSDTARSPAGLSLETDNGHHEASGAALGLQLSESESPALASLGASRAVSDEAGLALSASTAAAADDGLNLNAAVADLAAAGGIDLDFNSEADIPASAGVKATVSGEAEALRSGDSVEIDLSDEALPSESPAASVKAKAQGEAEALPGDGVISLDLDFSDEADSMAPASVKAKASTNVQGEGEALPVGEGVEIDLGNEPTPAVSPTASAGVDIDFDAEPLPLRTPAAGMTSRPSGVAYGEATDIDFDSAGAGASVDISLDSSSFSGGRPLAVPVSTTLAHSSLPGLLGADHWRNTAASLAAAQGKKRLEEELSAISSEVPSNVVADPAARSSHFLRALDCFENLSQMVKTNQRADLVDDLLDSVYDIEDSLDSSTTPGWVWNVLSTIEDLLTTHKERGDLLSPNVANLLRQSVNIIENYQEGGEQEAMDNINELLNSQRSLKPTPSSAAASGPQPPEGMPAMASAGLLGQTIADPNLDTILAQTFMDEAQMLFSRCQNKSELWEADREQTRHLDSIRRDMHTLKGSARMAGYLAIGDLAHSVESLIDSVATGYIQSSARVGKTLTNALWAGDEMLESIRDGYLPTPNPQVMNNISACLNQALPYGGYGVNPSIFEEGEYRELDAGSPAATPAPAEALPAATSPGREERSLGSNLFNPDTGSEEFHQDSERELVNAANLASQVNALSGKGSGFGDELREEAQREAAKALPVEADEDEEASEPVRYLAEDENIDPDIVSIFTDEAQELLATSSKLLAEPLDDKDKIQELQRAMHTLKGGSRLAGLTTIGDVSHWMESIVEKMADMAPEQAAKAQQLLNVALESQYTMLDSVLRGEFPAPVPELVQCLERFANTGELQLPKKKKKAEKAQAPAEALPSGTPERPALDEAAPAPTQETAKQEPPVPAEALPSGAEAEAQAARERLKAEAEAKHSQAAFDELAEKARQQRESKAPGLKDMANTAEEEKKFTDQRAQLQADKERKAKEKAEAERKNKLQKKETNSDLSRFVRVDADLLDEMIAMLGESTIMRSRMENVTAASEYNLTELSRLTARIADQVRRFDNETEAQIRSRRDSMNVDDEHFDPLEMDRFSELQQLSRQLAEAIDDLKNIQETLTQDNTVLRNLTIQQGDVQRDLQDRLLTTQLMRFDVHEPRLKRLIKQTAASVGKEVNFALEGGEVELERRLLEDLLPSLEHMIRNSIAHGIETPEVRRAAGKPEAGTIRVAVGLRTSEISVRIIDDGAGIDYDKIRAKAKAKGILDPERANDETYLNGLMMRSGFSTAENLSQLSGRGVGMDVVHEMLKQRRGQIQAFSIRGKGTEFDISMPFSMSIAEVLLVEIAGQTFAAPMSSITAVTQIERDELLRSAANEVIFHRYQDIDYRVFILGQYFKPEQYVYDSEELRAPVLLIHTGMEAVAFHVDKILNRMEIIVKNVNRQVLNIPGISGATILGDGRVAPVLEVLDLARRISDLTLVPVERPAVPVEVTPNILVVDDSVTMRKVSTRLLERNHYNVATAKDGLDAIEVLKTYTPDLIMLDIEMPNMDGFEFASHVRQMEDPRLRNVPIVMITSRTGDKHRERAGTIGVQDYLGKPYREDVLLATLERLLQK